MSLANVSSDTSEISDSWVRKTGTGNDKRISSKILAGPLAAGMAIVAPHSAVTAPPAVGYTDNSDSRIIHVAEDYRKEQLALLDGMSTESTNGLKSEDELCATGKKPFYIDQLNHLYEPGAYDVCVRAAVESAKNMEAFTLFYRDTFKEFHLSDDDYQNLPFVIMQAVVFNGKKDNGKYFGKYFLNINPHKALVVDLPNALIAQLGLTLGAVMKNVPISPDPNDSNLEYEQTRLNEIMERVGSNRNAERIVRNALDNRIQTTIDQGDIFVAAYQVGESAVTALASHSR